MTVDDGGDAPHDVSSVSLLHALTLPPSLHLSRTSSLSRVERLNAGRRGCATRARTHPSVIVEIRRGRLLCPALRSLSAIPQNSHSFPPPPPLYISTCVRGREQPHGADFDRRGATTRLPAERGWWAGRRVRSREQPDACSAFAVRTFNPFRYSARSLASAGTPRKIPPRLDKIFSSVARACLSTWMLTCTLRCTRGYLYIFPWPCSNVHSLIPLVHSSEPRTSSSFR